MSNSRYDFTNIFQGACSKLDRGNMSLMPMSIQDILATFYQVGSFAHALLSLWSIMAGLWYLLILVASLVKVEPTAFWCHRSDS